MRYFLAILGGIILVLLANVQAADSFQTRPELNSYISHYGKQLLVSVAEDWSSTHTTLYGFSRRDENSPWELNFAYPGVLGRKGLGWGLGIHGKTLDQHPTKHEGDLRSPAGVFRLPTLFGYASEKEAGVRSYPYVQVTKDTLAVDDPRSPFYNQMIERTKNDPKLWKSAEIMLRPDGAYRLGLWVSHNDPLAERMPPILSKGLPVPGSEPLGSCIFIHIWRSPDNPTVGCTAIAPQNMEAMVRWLRSDNKPLLVQLPLKEYQHVQNLWNLPTLPPLPKPFSSKSLQSP